MLSLLLLKSSSHGKLLGSKILILKVKIHNPEETGKVCDICSKENFLCWEQKSGLLQEPLPRALFDLPCRSWVGSDLNNKAVPCTADESSSFLVGLAGWAAGNRRRNEPGTQSQKLWLGPGCVALSGRRDGRLSARTIIQTWQRGSQPLNCESGSCSSRCVLRVRRPRAR